ncbi:hypothetical protein [Streptomyces noursei]|uniref:hypothetical protein n=1 Tax=Streptomyces noursei TaxID=1971 RepID=UPI0030F08DE1
MRKAVAPETTVRNEYGCDVAAQAVQETVTAITDRYGLPLRFASDTAMQTDASPTP